MWLNGIHSYGTRSMSYYSYQAAMNNIRLTQALSGNPKIQAAVPQISPTDTPLKDSYDFIKEYSSSVSSLMKAASELKGTNASGAMNDLFVSSSDLDVATVSENLTIRKPNDFNLSVSQLAQSQQNISNVVKVSDPATGNMDFTISRGRDSVHVQVNAVGEDGVSLTNGQMLREAARQINCSSVGIRATMVRYDGEVALKLEGLDTGTANRFKVDGDLGAAAGMDHVQTDAVNARYSVTADGITKNYTSSDNRITLDGSRISVELKTEGETKIQTGLDTERISSAVENLTECYNDVLTVLHDNYDRGTGIHRQLQNLVRGLGAEKSLEMLGITVNEDATLSFDKTVLKENIEKNSSLVRDLISGTGGIADIAFNKAVGGMNMNSSSLINKDISYLHNNYYAVGLMMDYFI